MREIPFDEFVELFASLDRLNLFAGSAISSASGMPVKTEFIDKPLIALA